MEKKKRLPLAAKIVIIVLAVAVVAGGGVFFYINHILNRIDRIDPDNEHQMTPEEAEEYDREEWDADNLDIDGDNIKPPDKEFAELEPDLNNADIKLVQDPNVTNILLIGCDARDSSYVGRSDTIMICSINKNTNKITIVSILRDTYVEIDGYKNNKINASYAFGGTGLLDRTIEKNLGVHIDHNVLVNFDGFVNAMTEVGDLEISLSAAEVEYLNSKYPKWDLKQGKNTLTPTQLLAYSRIRKIDGADWGRTERQRKVIMAAFNKYRSQGLSAVLDLVNRVTPYIRTDMSNGQMISTAQEVLSKGMGIAKTESLPNGNMYRSMYVRLRAVLVPDLAAMSKALHQLLYGVD